MKGPNVSEWALEHQSLVLFFMLALAAAGLFSYFKLGQAEDPEFTFKVMDQAAYCRLRNAQPSRCLADIQFFGSGHEVSKMA